MKPLEIKYSSFIKKAWQFSWKHKFLWWFGFFVSLANGGAYFNFSLNDEDNFRGGSVDEASRWAGEHMEILIAILAVAFILFVFILVASLVGKGALVKCAYLWDKNENISFKTGLRQGLKYFWKLFGLNIIIGLVMLASLLILATPVVIVFLQKMIIAGFLLTFAAASIFIPLAVVIIFIGRFSMFYIVTSELKIFDAIESSYLLFKKNIWPSIIMALLIWAISLLAILILIFTLFLLTLPFLLLGAISYFLLGQWGAIAVLIGGLTIFALIAALLSSIFQTFYHAAWFYFFREIASHKDGERVEVLSEEKIINEKAPSPESV